MSIKYNNKRVFEFISQVFLSGNSIIDYFTYFVDNERLTQLARSFL